MNRLHTRIACLIVAGFLTACSSTMPQTAANVRPAMLPTVTPDQPTGAGMPATSAAILTPTSPPPTPTPGDGPVTATMAQLKMDGERYAALGDPNAPITVIEFSDYG